MPWCTLELLGPRAPFTAILPMIKWMLQGFFVQPIWCTIWWSIIIWWPIAINTILSITIDPVHTKMWKISLPIWWSILPPRQTSQPDVYAVGWNGETWTIWVKLTFKMGLNKKTWRGLVWSCGWFLAHFKSMIFQWGMKNSYKWSISDLSSAVS